VEAHRGRWGWEDWSALRERLRHSEFWPLDLEAAEEVLGRQAAEWHNLRRWEQSGEPRRWVEAHHGRWGHDDWLSLLDHLRRSAYWPLDPGAVGGVLEQAGRLYGNLRRWHESGEARRWVEARHGRWTPADWQALLGALRHSEFWPLDPGAAEELLRTLAAEWHNLCRWRDSGGARRWVEARQALWGHADWQALLGALRHSEFWPLDPGAVGGLLREARRRWWNLRRWRDSGLAHRWVETRRDRWGRDDWLALQEELRGSGFWPVDPAALGRVLKEVRAQWRNLRRWQESGGPRRWVEAHRGGWGREDWRSLLDSLRHSEFWPLDPMAVWRAVEGLRPPARRIA
jgi:hypothetical protein